MDVVGQRENSKGKKREKKRKIEGIKEKRGYKMNNSRKEREVDKEKGSKDGKKKRQKLIRG